MPTPRGDPLTGARRASCCLACSPRKPHVLPDRRDTLRGVAFEHESFWVAVATAAPILALANQITLTDALSALGAARAIRDDILADLSQQVGAMNRLAGVTSYFVGAANLFAQTAALGIALVSLANSEDAFSWAVPLAVILEVVGLVAIGSTAAFSGFARGRQSQVESVIRETAAFEREWRRRQQRGGPADQNGL
jgi:hypothetical protein